MKILNKENQTRVDLYSRPNTMNGKHSAGKLGLDNLSGVKSSNIFFLETLKMKADLADKMIEEAESQGKNTSDSKIMKELGEKINAIGTPIQRSVDDSPQFVAGARKVGMKAVLYEGGVRL